MIEWKPLVKRRPHDNCFQTSSSSLIQYSKCYAQRKKPIHPKATVKQDFLTVLDPNTRNQQLQSASCREPWPSVPTHQHNTFIPPLFTPSSQVQQAIDVDVHSVHRPLSVQIPSSTSFPPTISKSPPAPHGTLCRSDDLDLRCVHPQVSWPTIKSQRASFVGPNRKIVTEKSGWSERWCVFGASP